MLAVARTFALVGIEAEPVYVELDLRSGLPAFTIVGLPDTAVRESRERVRAALSNSGFEFPLRRITANLAPADLPKAGPGFDLATAAALLVATNQIPNGVLERYTFAGELALDGSIRPVPGALAMAEAARELGMRGIAVAPGDADQAALVEGIEVVAVDHVERLTALASGELEPVPTRSLSAVRNGTGADDRDDLADLKGQPVLRHALEVAAAGGHSMLLVGPPGAGKTLAARRLPGLLPDLSTPEALEVARIASACANGATPSLTRPFRAPHHTVSARALVGGGSPPRPGEATRAHCGVLFLDELGEFRRDALEALRQPLEEGRVLHARASGNVSLPCRFTLIAASNPCPCGRGEDSGECECHHTAAARYRAKLSGALADRIDVTIGVERPSAEAMAGDGGEGSAAVRARVAAARAIQDHRQGLGRCNADLKPEELRVHCKLDAESESVLRNGHDQLRLSGRGWDRVLRLARTIADLADEERIDSGHVLSALGLRRRLDRR